MSLLQNSNAISTAGGYDINNSLRLRSSASAYLNRTPSVTGNQRTFTFSSWIKRGTLGTNQTLLEAFYGGSTRYTIIYFTSSDTIRIFGGVYSTGASTTTSVDLITTQVFRDPSAWYHIVISVDTTQATAANRVKLYVNGNQVTSFSTSTYPALNDQTYFNVTTTPNYISETAAIGNGFPYDGYMSDVYLVDGQQLEPYYFGNNDANGVWKPILYKGTYGTNGFYLTFGNTTSTTTLGYDSSPNGNNWTCNNISLTAGTTYDAMTDVPTNTSATVANYAVLNPLNKGASLTVSNGNLYADATTTTVATTYSTLRIDTATYWENYISATDGAGYPLIGAGTGISTGGVTGAGSWSVGSDGYTYLNGTSANAGYTFTSTDIIQCAYDPVTGKFWLGKNNTWFGSGNPATGANPVATIATSNQIYALISHYGNSNSSANFGQRPFSYTPPTGFVALNTFNLPTPTILQGNKYMDATLYTGTGATLSITNAGAFKPDFVWMKGRSNVRNNNLYDSVRGTTKELNSNTTGAETTNATGLTAFNSNGWTIGSDGGINTSSETYVGWQWQAGQGSTSSNTQGSITSTVSVNTTAGFSIVTYTGNGTTATIGHGLGVAPKMILLKKRNATANWSVYHVSPGATQVAELNLTNAFSASGQWGNTAPTSTVFTQSADNGINWLAYCWAEIAGFSKFTSYTGNGSADGVFVYLGFRPKFVMTKRTDTTSDWIIYDTSRNTYNVTDLRLFPNLSNAETQAGAMDLLSNGFKLRDTGASQNASGGTYIVMAFAEHPFKNSNAR